MVKSVEVLNNRVYYLTEDLKRILNDDELKTYKGEVVVIDNRVRPDELTDRISNILCLEGFNKKTRRVVNRILDKVKLLKMFTGMYHSGMIENVDILVYDTEEVLEDVR